jgi:hypothetical protein
MSKSTKTKSKCRLDLLMYHCACAMGVHVYSTLLGKASLYCL